MTYIAFLAATLLYFSVGPGGPLHNDRWFHALRGRVDALEPDFWMGFVLLVVVPCAAFALVYGLLQEMFGEAAVLLLGAAALFFSLGRQDWAALLNRFKARAVAGDLEGAVLTLEAAGSDPIKADDPDSAVDASLRILLFEGFQRWFPPVLYFLLLGPVAAVGYRLIVMGSNDRQVPLGSLRHFLDWLPSRVLLLTFGIVGNFEAIRPVLAERSFDADIATDELLLEALEVAMPAQTGEVGDRAEQLRQGLQSALVVWVLVASILVIVS